MGSYPAFQYCESVSYWLREKQLFEYLTNQYGSFDKLCSDVFTWESNSITEGWYGQPMVLIGVYISIASLFCILAMTLDLLYGFQNRKFWFPTKYFSLNAASITVITVAMKLPVDLTSPMPGEFDQVAKIGGLAFMCTMMSNLMPSLASMDNKSLLANVTGLSILVITLIVNVGIQIKTRVIYANYLRFYHMSSSIVMVACVYMGMLLFLLIILISSAITIPASKKILEFKYQVMSKTTLNDQHPQENPISSLEKLRQIVKRYWIMAQTGSPQFVMASNPLSSAVGIICAFSMVIYISMVWQIAARYEAQHPKVIAREYNSVYKASMIAIVSTQSIGIVVGSISPILRCFAVLSLKSFDNQKRKHFLVFKVENYWTKKLCEWKENDKSFYSSDHTSRTHFLNLKNCILSFCIGFQKTIVVSCKIIGLVPIVVIIFVMYCLYYFKSMRAMLFTPSPVSSGGDTNKDLSGYVLLLEDDMRLANKTVKGISESMSRLIKSVEKKHLTNFMKLLEQSVSFDGVVTFDTGGIQSLLSIDFVNSWSLPIVSLTCIAIALPNVHKNKVDNLLKGVGEGLLYTHLVEESLNKSSEYVNIRRATNKVWHEVDGKHKWLNNTLERNAFKGKTPTQIISSFAHIAEEILNDFSKSTNGELVEKENLPLKIIVANSMHLIAQTIMHTYESNNLEIIEDELFSRLSSMIADILAACLTNLPQVITLRCQESAIEKREASVVAAVSLLGRATKIIKVLEARQLPKMDRDKMGFIDEWHLHLSQP